MGEHFDLEIKKPLLFCLIIRIEKNLSRKMLGMKPD